MYVYFSVLIVLALIIAMVLQAGHLKREFIKIGGALNIRICLLTDLHMGLLMVTENDVAKALREEKPDILIIGGDIIEDEKDISAFVSWFRQISPQCPVFLTLGNHDYRCFTKKQLSKEIFFFNLNSLGIQVLINESAPFYKNGKSINIIGLDDYKCGDPQVKHALSLKDENADFNLAIAHNPEIALFIPHDEVDLLLCGHFHGGQIWLPFGLEFKLLRKEETSKLGHRRGLHTINGNLTYVSRGIGNVVLPFRLGSMPEITFIDI